MIKITFKPTQRAKKNITWERFDSHETTTKSINSFLSIIKKEYPKSTVLNINF